MNAFLNCRRTKRAIGPFAILLLLPQCLMADPDIAGQVPAESDVPTAEPSLAALEPARATPLRLTLSEIALQSIMDRYQLSQELGTIAHLEEILVTAPVELLPMHAHRARHLVAVAVLAFVPRMLVAAPYTAQQQSGDVAISPAASTASASADDCEPSGGYSFVCGLRNAEDLVLVPGTKWIIASGMAADGALYLIDSRQKTWTELYPGATPRARHDTQTYGACPGAPGEGGMVTHGLNIRPDGAGRATLYVVGHGAREAIEVFQVDASAEVPVLTWRGCIPTPNGMEANSVASLADGSLLVTIPLHTGISIATALAGNLTGAVYRWSPGGTGFEKVVGTELPYANGVEASADGKEFYVASSGLASVLAYSNTDPAQLLRRTEPLTFIPDNLHAGPDGRLLTAGLNIADAACGDVKQSEEFSLEEFASCPRPFTVVAVDARSMTVDVVATGPANPRFSNVTMALPVDDELWIGTFAGDRVAYRPSSLGGNGTDSRP